MFSRISFSNIKLINLFLLSSLVSLATLITYFYVGSEKTIYWSDLVTYQYRTIELISTYQDTPLRAIILFLGSFTREYNNLFCLPLIPFMLIFGESRFVYILSCVLVYLIPFCFVMGAIATKLIPCNSRSVFWSTAFLALSIPTTWLSTLRGYPDIGGAVLIGLAIWLYLKDIKLRNWQQILLLAFFLSSSILFRRHFAYGVRAFLVTLFLQGFLAFLAEIKVTPKEALRTFIQYGIRLSLLTFTILMFSPILVYKILTTNYRFLYYSYEKSLIVNLQYFIEIYGWLLLFLTLIGFSAGFFTRLLRRPVLFFITFFGSISFIQWIFFSKQIGVHYTNHFNFFIILGTASFFWITQLILKRKKRFIVLILGAFMIPINLLMGLTPMGRFNLVFRPLWSMNFPPLIDSDYAEFIKLVTYLRSVSPNQKPLDFSNSLRNIDPHQAGIYLPYSDVFADSILKEAEKQIYGSNSQILNFLRIPAIDSRDFYPLERLLQSHLIIIPTYFPNPKYPIVRYQIAQVVLDIFQQNQAFAHDFKKLPQTFTFQDRKIQVSIYERIHPTNLETTLKTLELIKSQIKPIPSNQSQWIILATKYKGEIYKNSDESVNIATYQTSQLSLLYFGSLPNKIQLKGTVESFNNQCQGLTLNLMTLDKQGKMINEINQSLSYRFDFQVNTQKNWKSYLNTQIIKTNPEIAYLLSPNVAHFSDESLNFLLSIPNQNATYLRLDITPQEDNKAILSCSPYLKNLNIL